MGTVTVNVTIKECHMSLNVYFKTHLAK